MRNKLGSKLMGGGLAVVCALLMSPAPALAQDYGPAGGYNNYAPAGQLDNLVSRIALYPDPLLAQIFAAAAFPDQIAAAAQGSNGPFDPSVEALMQYPSVLQMMASDPGWTQSLGQAVTQDQGAVMDAIQNLRREAQQYGYLQSGPQMQVMDNGGYIDIEPVGGYLYVPMYDPFVVFARPRPGFFVGGAIRFGGGFRWAGGGYDRFNWGSHEMFVNRRVWTPSVHGAYGQPQRQFAQRPFENNRGNFAGGNGGWNRGYAAPATRPQAPQSFGRQQFQQRTAPVPQQRSFNQTPRQMPQRNFAAPQQAPQRNFAAPRQAPQRNFAAPRQMPQRSFTPQARAPQGGNGGQHFQRGNEGRGRR